MKTLEEYLSDAYHRDRQDIEAIEATLQEVVDTFSVIFKDGQWPYDFRTTDAKVKAPAKVSQGTLAMVLVATGRMLDFCPLKSGGRAQLKLECDELKENWAAALERLIRDLGTQPGIWSSSFGADNPLTLSHVAELQEGLRTQPNFHAKHTEISSQISSASKKLEKLIKLSLSPEDKLLKPNEGDYFANAFVPLRTIRAAEDLAIAGGAKGRPYRKFFESTLHDQLSFSAIPDSRFDPAELLFCLEGLLLCAPQAVDPALFEQVLEVLAVKQDSSAHWRPNKPFVANAKGNIMLPLSVEGANSLMRSIAIVDENRLYDTFTGKAVPMLRRFWQWLRARAVKFERKGRACAGWHSEHVNEPNLVHIWDTSQVVDFMLGYRELLQRHIARETLVLSRVPVREPDPPKPWPDVVARREPVSFLGSHYEVFRRVGEDFVAPWQAKRPTNFSMLLYGPPGTGKTSLAEHLADALGFRMLTVTVSDFLGLGGEMVEVRAKAIFQMLEAQANCVILFDEIDSFLLDRDSRHYRAQSTLFQFLTPGMLTKINDLRRSKRSIFIIATNYENRIDPAIKRPGRVDKRYLLLPPDKARRIEMYRNALNNVSLKAADLKAISNASLFLGFSDIQGVVQRAGGESAKKADLLIEARDAPRSTGHRFYLNRLLHEKANFPAEELACLLQMGWEIEHSVDGLAELAVMAEPAKGQVTAELERIRIRGQEEGLNLGREDS